MKERLEIGQIVNTFGIKGFVKIYPYVNELQRFDDLKKVKETNEYNNNTKKINLYKNILKNNYQVNSEFIEEFIDLIEEKLELEYENGINNFVKYIDYRNKIDL